jgi:hypothetical protein
MSAPDSWLSAKRLSRWLPVVAACVRARRGQRNESREFRPPEFRAAACRRRASVQAVHARGALVEHIAHGGSTSVPSGTRISGPGICSARPSSVNACATTVGPVSASGYRHARISRRTVRTPSGATRGGEVSVCPRSGSAACNGFGLRSPARGRMRRETQHGRRPSDAITRAPEGRCGACSLGRICRKGALVVTRLADRIGPWSISRLESGTLLSVLGELLTNFRSPSRVPHERASIKPGSGV